MVLPLFFAIVLLVVLLLALYARWNYGVLETLNIPVVKPHFLLGSAFQYRNMITGYRDIELMKQYGQVFGLYSGREPQVYICDPELLRLIMVKDSSYFDGKSRLDFGDAFLNEMPDYLPGEKWRIVRSITSPAFSSAKLRLMNFPMKDSLTEFIHEFKMKVENTTDSLLQKCNIDDVLFKGLTDLTLRCLFSITDKTERFPKLLKKFAKPEGLEYETLNHLALSFPFLYNFLPLSLLHPQPAQEFMEIMENLIDTRLKTQTENKTSAPDVVDICIEQLKKLETPEYKNAKITKETILFQAFNFFFSGQDETALVISAMIYHISKSPEIQEKLYQEVDKLWESSEDGQLPREKLLEAEYLQACINEALRMYTFYHTERVCTKDWFCEKYNFKIPKGMTVIVSLWPANRNPDYFENPMEFDPERFMSGNKEKLHPYAWSPFGHGNRHCTGKPLAMEVFRYACAYLFKEFQYPSLTRDTLTPYLTSLIPDRNSPSARPVNHHRTEKPTHAETDPPQEISLTRAHLFLDVLV
ncbi:Cytochrome P450 3A56 [Orchesella cincta]|uniref:Cytochrome P450 3A56 n=1 Tax=Orchesella cincta TaxID=48709 RepID=A0A1D2N156_ORCCI|nr:Cytochrome P450 3A56 [Orchesella cincta]